MDRQDRQEAYLTPCQRCGSSAMARVEDDDLCRAGLTQIWCYGCQDAYRRLAHDVMTVLEQHAGFTQEHRVALAHLAGLAVNDPQRALTVQSLSQRVEGLGKEVSRYKWLLTALITVFTMMIAVSGVLVGILTS